MYYRIYICGKNQSLYLVSCTMRGHSIIYLFMICILVQNVRGTARIDPLVNTNIGLIRGLRADDGEYATFTGIPYATVDPTNPFGPAIPHPGFEDEFEAYNYPEKCPQIDEFTLEATGNLNCLHLNVYVPNSASSRNRLPVLVWIHGGGFELGDSENTFYGPTYLVKHDVILVSLNYRLGPYGFMCLDTPKVPGNQGLKDQQLALKWIKNNIEAFGGDNDKITIFGESAGGVSVDLHLYYSDERLFNRVIVQSGTALSPFGVLEPDPTSPIKIANHLGFETDNIEDALSFVSTSDSNLVIAAATELEINFRPCVEKDFENVEAFMKVHPVNSNINRKDYSVLIGHNDNESSVFLQYYRDIEFLKGLINLYLIDYFNFESDVLIENEKVIKHFYIGDEEVNEDTQKGIVDFDSDIIFTYPTARSILKYIKNNAKSVYYYVFSYNGGRNIAKKLINATTEGAAHFDEVGYLFSQTINTEEPAPEDQMVIDQMTTLWTNFAKYGNPTPEESELLPLTWPPVTKDTFFYLDIDSELSIQSRPLHARMAFWDLFYKINCRAQKGFQDLTS